MGRLDCFVVVQFKHFFENKLQWKFILICLSILCLSVHVRTRTWNKSHSINRQKNVIK
jgi:hypothetical protein